MSWDLKKEEDFLNGEEACWNKGLIAQRYGGQLCSKEAEQFEVART